LEVGVDVIVHLCVHIYYMCVFVSVHLFYVAVFIDVALLG